MIGRGERKGKGDGRIAGDPEATVRGVMACELKEI
jgi:hypothetical protein